jgi:hypothetical protein
VRYNGGTGQYAITSTATTQGVTEFLVARMDFGTSTTPDVVHLWLNPTPGVQPTDASANAVLTLSSGVHFPSGTLLSLYSYLPANQATFDELRYGLSYASVAPDPLVNAGAAPRLMAPSAAAMMAPVPPVLSGSTPALTVFPKISIESLLPSFAAPAVPTSAIDISWHYAAAGYALDDADAQETDDASDPLTLDPSAELYFQL